MCRKPRVSLLARLPHLMPLVRAWAAEVQAAGLQSGRPLAFWQQADARNVGVIQVARVRLCLVDAMPTLSDPQLAAAAADIGLLGPDTVGLALGYAVYILRTQAGERRLLRHELRHVAQCESAGGMDTFLAEYLEQVARFGYAKAPFEMEARRYERCLLTGLDD